MADEESKRPLNIVVLGASFAGLSVAHSFLDETINRLGKTSVKTAYRLVIISPSSHLYWNIAAPRTLVAPGLIKESDAFIPIEPGFRRHKGKNFVFIQAFATSWDREARTVQIEVIGPRAQKRAGQIDDRGKSGVQDKYSIPYHALIIATGTSAHSPLLSLHGPHTKTMKALRVSHQHLKEANSIVIAGGGPSGVEIAGQLATYLNHATLTKLPSFLSKGKYVRPQSSSTKRITLVMATDSALPKLPGKIGLRAEQQLKGLGVHLVKQVRVIDAVENFGEQSKTKIVLSDGKSLMTDVYIAATGVSPNTAFVPGEVLDDNGYIVTGDDLGWSTISEDKTHVVASKQTLRVREGGERVYAVGDCASYSANYVLDAYLGVPPLIANLEKDLWAWELREANPYGGAEEEIEEREDAILERPLKIESQLCPISRYGGVGILFGHAVPSLMVYLAKGRDYRVGKGSKVVEDGNNPY